jgi:acyl-homoserine lactone acylase PvdQ
MFRRLLTVSFAVFLVLCVAGAGLLFWAAKRAEPPYSGEATVPGLTAPVQVRYGPHAVPTIEAENLADLLFAQGYVVASERMWQMDMMRRLASGRLAEVLGEKALPVDRFFRTIGLAKAAEEGFEALEDEYKGYLEAYAAGVNAYRTEAARRLPLEYLIGGFEPAPWTPRDSLVVGEYMGWMLSFNAREELVYLRLAARVGKARALELFPSDEGIPAPDEAAMLPDGAIAQTAELEALFALPAEYGLPIPAPTSNAWAINGERTEEGQALLANDVHLAPSVPGVWYELELKAPGFHVTGAALPGAPFVIIGHNEHLAWGFTTVIADTQDIFVEQVSDDGAHVRRPQGEPEPIQSREESVRVRGRKAPWRFSVRSTRHGVILNDVLGDHTATPMDLPAVETRHLLALRQNLEVPGRAIPAFHGLNTATTLEAARIAIADLRHASMNLMLADRHGGIAWQVSGLIPKRGRGPGTFPSPGWEPGYGWTGYFDPRHNPGLVNPAGYALVTANQRTIPPDQEIQLSRSWMAPYRAQRIQQMLGARNPLTAEDLERMQLDRVSIQALRFKQALGREAARIRVLDPEARRIADEYLMTWDGSFGPGSRAAALFVLLRPALFEALFGDELGEELPALLSIAIAHYNGLEEALYSGESSFWDDIRTSRKEGAAHVWARALRRAKSQLDQRFPQLGSQRLDRLRWLAFPHAFDRVPILGPFFGIGPLGAAGDTHTVNTMKASPQNPEKALFIPTFRAIFTPADWPASRSTLPLGQSGHRFSPYRRDQLEDWLQGRTHSIQWEGPAPGQEIGIRLLKPAAS